MSANDDTLESPMTATECMERAKTQVLQTVDIASRFVKEFDDVVRRVEGHNAK